MTLRQCSRLLWNQSRSITQTSLASCQASSAEQSSSETIQPRPRQESLSNVDFFQRVVHRFPIGCAQSQTWPLAFAYGSGVFEQDGNVSKGNMTDLVLVVENSEEWHKQNLAMNPKDYTRLMSLMGPKVLGDMQDKFGAKAYFNTLIPFEDGLIKYGVISRSNLIADLLDWESLYIAGRLQKPVRVLSKATKTVDQELHLGLRMNLKNALHTAFLLLPEKFTEERLYHTLVGLSYTGDFRMQVGEDKFKVSKITKGSINELRGLYAHQMTKMSEFVYFPRDTAGTDPSKQIFEQDTSPGARHFHLIMQPKNMQECLVREWNQDGRWRDVEDVLRSAAYDRDIEELITKCLMYVVSKPAVVQAAKGILTAGLSKTIIYSSKKVSKMLISKMP